jgi:uncharacterized membrane protein
MTIVFTSLVCVATMAFSVYVPHTRGFFNIGETIIYTTALLFGPLIGAFAGGVGSMIADIFLGYPYYAPATLVIKACEGGIVGALNRKKVKFGSPLQWKLFTLCVGLISGILLGTVGSLYYSGSVQLSLGLPPPENPTYVIFIPPEFWYLLGAFVVVVVTLMGFVFEPEFGWPVFTIFAGGSVMVAGYFIYQQFFLGPLFSIPVLAIAEIPVNLGQLIIGLIVSIPLVRAILRALPFLKP